MDRLRARAAGFGLAWLVPTVGRFASQSAAPNRHPDDDLLRRVGGIIGRFPEVERQAADYLREHEAEIGKAALEVYGLEVTEGNRPDDFSLEFLADGDDSRVWRVEFEAGQPKQTGFDD